MVCVSGKDIIELGMGIHLETTAQQDPRRLSPGIMFIRMSNIN